MSGIFHCYFYVLKLKHSLCISGEYVYWADKEIALNPTEIVNTVPFMKVRDYYTNLGTAMMATSYALTLYLDKNDFVGATPIMKWMQTQRNAMMRFSSTQVWLMMVLKIQSLTLQNSLVLSNKTCMNTSHFHGSAFSQIIKEFRDGTSIGYTIYCWCMHLALRIFNTCAVHEYYWA